MRGGGGLNDSTHDLNMGSVGSAQDSFANCFMLHSTGGTSHYFHCLKIVTFANIHCTSVAHSEVGFATVSCHERHLILTQCRKIRIGDRKGALRMWAQLNTVQMSYLFDTTNQ